jgi:hypothetical protein
VRIQKLGHAIDCPTISVDSDQEVLRRKHLDKVPSVAATTERSVNNGSRMSRWAFQTRPMNYLLEQDGNVDGGRNHYGRVV